MNMINVKKTIEALLGRKVKDKVTGQEGVVTSISFDLFGCVQAVVDPGIDKDQKRIDSHWMDTHRLVVKKGKPVMELPTFQYDTGPADKPIM